MVKHEKNTKNFELRYNEKDDLNIVGWLTWILLSSDSVTNAYLKNKHYSIWVIGWTIAINADVANIYISIGGH